jgi:hypothetical protein
MMLGGAVGATVGVAGAVTTAHASGAYDQYKTLPPLNRTDKLMVGGGGDLGFSSYNDSLYSNYFSQPLRDPSAAEISFGDSLKRDPAYEEKKKKAGAKPHPKDLLLANIMGYEKFMANQQATATADWQAWNSDENKFLAAQAAQATEDWQAWNSDDNKRIGAENEADKKSTAHWASVNERNAQDEQKSQSGFIAAQAAMPGADPQFAKDRLDQEQQDLINSYAMNTSSFEEYERRKTEIATLYNQKRKQLEQNTTIQNIQQYGMYTANAATLANNLYTLLGKKNRTYFDIAKGINLANTAMNTAEAVMKAYAQTGIFGGPIAAAIVGAVGASQMAIIAAQQPDGGGSSGGSGGGSFTMPSGSAPVTQPVSQQQSPNFSIVMNFDGTTLVDEQKLTRWTEDVLLPSMRDLKTRGVSA